MKLKGIERGFIFAFGALIGIFLGMLFCNWSYFEFEKTIKYSDLFTLLVTTGIGLYIAVILTHKEGSSRAERDFFMDEIKSIIRRIDKLKLYASANQFPFNETKKIFKEINENLYSLEELLRVSSSCNSVALEDEIRQNIWAARRLILNVSPVNNFITLNLQDQVSSETQLRSIRMSLSKLILRVNE